MPLYCTRLAHLQYLSLWLCNCYESNGLNVSQSLNHVDIFHSIVLKAYISKGVNGIQEHGYKVR